MTGAQIITRTMEQFPENELIFASKLYTEQLSEAVSEEAYYQTLGRMCKAGTLCRIAKGTYYRPKTSKYGIVPPSQKEIVAAFTEPDKGTVVGYSLYNSLKLTTQVAKTVEQMCEILSISTKTGYRILREGKICCLKVGRAYRIPKAHLFTFLCIGCGEAVTA